MSDWMTAAGVKYVTMNDSCRSQVFQCMTPTRVKLVSVVIAAIGIIEVWV